jgi:hypothetical protein
VSYASYRSLPGLKAGVLKPGLMAALPPNIRLRRCTRSVSKSLPSLAGPPIIPGMKALLSTLCLIGFLRPAMPQVMLESRVPSIQLSSGTAPSGEAFITVKNSSPHAVLKWSSRLFSSKGSGQQGPIKAGDSIVLSPASELLVTAAVFDDGSYEGDAATAARMAEEYLGDMVQFERIRKCTEEVLAGSGSDEEKFNSIRDAITNLPIHPDQGVIDRLAQDFPSLVHELPSLTSAPSRRFGGVFVGMNMGKSGALGFLKDFRARFKSSTPDDWWQMMKRSFEPSFLLDYPRAEPTAVPRSNPGNG